MDIGLKLRSINVNKYHYFFGGHKPTSNWFPAIFVWKDKQFNNSEAAMMWGKAMLHKDEKTANKVLINQNPKVAKVIGRKMVGFDYHLWGKYKFDIMVDLLLCKFTQCAKSKEYLLSIKEEHFVEASPYDKIWGIGLSETDPRAANEDTWKGQNLLGKALDEVRKVILSNPTLVHTGRIITQ